MVFEVELMRLWLSRLTTVTLWYCYHCCKSRRQGMCWSAFCCCDKMPDVSSVAPEGEVHGLLSHHCGPRRGPRGREHVVRRCCSPPGSLASDGQEGPGPLPPPRAAPWPPSHWAPPTEGHTPPTSTTGWGPSLQLRPLGSLKVQAITGHLSKMSLWFATYFWCSLESDCHSWEDPAPFRVRGFR